MRWPVFRDALSGLEYLRNAGELVRDGLYVELDAYRCHLFLGFPHHLQLFTQRVGSAELLLIALEIGSQVLRG